MKFGCHLPVYGPVATRATILGFARRMESLGFDSLWASDHVVIPWKIRSRYPYNPTGDFPLSPETPFLEPLTTLAVVAGATEHIALGTTVLGGSGHDGQRRQRLEKRRSEEHTSELQSRFEL